MSKEIESNDLDLDFSSNSSIIGSLEDFLEKPVNDSNLSDQPDKTVEPAVEKTEDVVVEDTKTTDFDFNPKSEKELGIDIDIPSDIDLTPKNDSTFKSIINKLVENKLWDSIDAIDTGDGEIPFDEVDVDEDTFMEIFKYKLEEEKEKLSQNKISADGVSDFTKHLIEIEKNGGNVQQAIQMYNTYQSPLENLDITDPKDQQKVIYHRLAASNVPKDDILDLIDKYIQDDSLETKAKEAYSQLNDAFEKQMESMTEQAKANEENLQKQLKQYKSKVSENLNKFDLKDSYKKKLAELSISQDTNKQFLIDDLYYEMRNNPEKASDLLLFLFDSEEYNKQITESTKRSNNISTMKSVKVAKLRGGSNINIEEADRAPAKRKNTISLDNLR